MDWCTSSHYFSVIIFPNEIRCWAHFLPFLQKLRNLGCLKAITESLEQNKYKASDIGIPEIRHFLYKSKSTSLFTSPTYEAPYVTRAQQDTLLSLYQYVHQRFHSPTRPSRLLFHIGKSEAILGWVRVTTSKMISLANLCSTSSFWQFLFGYAICKSCC